VFCHATASWYCRSSISEGRRMVVGSVVEQIRSARLSEVRQRFADSERFTARTSGVEQVECAEGDSST
jgi:hypothetical protein